jgi:predicted acylesterase/phospholipase RssA
MDTESGDLRIRALTFGGGAFDTVMQLGVAHALLVRDGVAPDHVVGISAGAINAAALAEILQAGRDFYQPEQQLAARVRKMREFIDAYVDIPSEIVESTFPDAFEVNAQQALEPLELPVHFTEERKSRQDANRSRAGLILLINHFLRIRLTVAVMTKMIRRVLAIRQSEELKLPKKNVASTRVWNYAGIWFATLIHSYAASQIVATLAYAAIFGRRGYQQKSAGQIILAFRPLSVVWNAVKAAGAWLFFLSLLLSPVVALLRIRLPAWLTGCLDLGIAASAAFVRSALAKPLAGAIAFIGPGNRLLAVAFGGSWNAVYTIGRNLAIGRYLSLLPIGQQVRAHGASIVLAILVWLIALYLDFRFNVRGRWVLLVYLTVLFSMPLAVIASKPSGLTGLIGVLLAAGLWWYFGPAIPFMTRILEHYEIGDGILSADILLQELVHRFDPNYYGKHVVSEMNDAALQRADCVASETDNDSTPPRRMLSQYRRREPHIHVAPVAANLSSGRLEILTETTSIVRALLAATATSPLFPASDVAEETRPKKLLSRLFQKQKTAHKDSKWYIDGLNISNEPIQPLLDYLRQEFRDLAKKQKAGETDPGDLKRFEELRKATTVDVYPVSDLPVDHSELETPGNYSTLVEVGLRAIELKQLRDAAMERTLTRLYTATLGCGKAFVPGKDSNQTSRVYIHAGIFPIELDRPAHVNRRIIRGTSVDERRSILRATVADGCRASLEAMLASDLLDKGKLEGWAGKYIQPPVLPADLQKEDNLGKLLLEAIKHAIVQENDRVTLNMRGRERTISRTVSKGEFALLVDITNPSCRSIIEKRGQALPGNDPDSGPGVSEICKQCRLFREDKAATFVPVKGPAADPVPAATFDDSARLHGRLERLDWPIWPRARHGNTADDRVPSPRQQPPPPPPCFEWGKDWPSRRKESQSEASTKAVARPTVSFLFGGGVFRGVYHMGVMNALNEAGLRPDVVAGSSVGSIIAAMIASVFKEEDPINRGRQIRSLSTTFLAIDRFVLTDRLADFVRRLTLRGAEARFAPRDLDLVLRRYDIDFPGRFGKRARNLMAGLERLLYLSPFELFTIVRAARLQDFSCLLEEILGDLQELLDRGAVGDEILGSEPLDLLIQRQVEDPLRKLLEPENKTEDKTEDKIEKEIRFDTFLEGKRKMYFLATTTNLMRGALEIIGAPNTTTTHVSLRQGLLASSAFPAVFRPRHGWEVFVGDLRRDDLYIDGGVMDNLPVDAVARFLSQAARDGKIVGRPGAAPHLLFTASLEITRDVLPMDARTIGETRRNFFDVRSRAKTFNLNRKIDAYRAVQKRLDAIWHSQRVEDDWPLNLRVIAVKPNWLCNTFGFHPMLGFRRRKQAKSIAHGCATTLAELHANVSENEQWGKAWGIERLDFDEQTSSRKKNQRVLTPRRDARDGQCWFRKDGHICPFSKQWRLINGEKSEQDPEVRPEELRDLDAIYVSCGERKTHEPLDGVT